MISILAHIMHRRYTPMLWRRKEVLAIREYQDNGKRQSKGTYKRRDWPSDAYEEEVLPDKCPDLPRE